MGDITKSDFEDIGLLWGVYLNAAHRDSLKEFPINGITEKDVAAMLSLLSLSRIAKDDGNAYNWENLVGLATCGVKMDL